MNLRKRARKRTWHHIVEVERKIVAREIHDELAQYLTAMKWEIYSISDVLPKGNSIIQKRLLSINETIITTIDSVNRIIKWLHPGILYHDLNKVITYYLDDFSRRYSIKCNYNCSWDLNSLKNEIKPVAFRIIQEALTNVAKHADASEVEIDSVCNDKTLFLKIKDNGKGIDFQKLKLIKFSGIIGMKERAKLLNGNIEIRNRVDDRGTEVVISMPDYMLTIK